VGEDEDDNPVAMFHDLSPQPDSAGVDADEFTSLSCPESKAERSSSGFDSRIPILLSGPQANHDYNSIANDERQFSSRRPRFTASSRGKSTIRVPTNRRLMGLVKMKMVSRILGSHSP